MMTMRDFFKQAFENLDRLTGLKQYDKLLASEEFERDFAEILNALCRVCNQFDEIPNEDKQRIITRNMISDMEFNGFNARVVYKWLAHERNKYIKELAHQEQAPPENYKVLEGEQRSEWIKKWQESLGEGMKQVPRLSDREINSEGKVAIERKATGFKSASDAEEILMKHLIQRTGSAFYNSRKNLSDFKGLQIHWVGKYPVFAATQDEAEIIVEEAKAAYLLAIKKD